MSECLYIVAAGLGSRMGDITLPKALISINGIPNICNTIEKANPYFDSIFVVYNEEISELWETFESEIKSFSDKVSFVPIKSGLGDGHACKEALGHVIRSGEFYDNSTFIWGDAYVPNGLIFKECISQKHSCIPVVYEENPYVAIVEAKNNTFALFSRQNETTAYGYHDQSIFRFDTAEIHDALFNIHCSLWKGYRYITENREMSLLYAIHFLSNKSKAPLLFLTKYPVMGFNTTVELQKIEEKYGNE